jgi:hypothetical protein
MARPMRRAHPDLRQLQMAVRSRKRKVGDMATNEMTMARTMESATMGLE